MDFSE